MIIPDEAVQAAMARRADLPADRPDPAVLSDETLTRKMLEAAMPFLAAEERARIRALLPYNVNCCDGFPAAVADMIGEHGDDPWDGGGA